MYNVLYLRLLDLYYDCKAVNGGRRVLRFLDQYSIFCYNSLLIHPVVSTHFCTYVINLPILYTYFNVEKNFLCSDKYLAEAMYASQ